MHTIHHLPAEEHRRAYQELYRTLAPASTAVVVNGWDTSPLANLSKVLVRGSEKLYALKQRLFRAPQPGKKGKAKGTPGAGLEKQVPKGTYVRKHNAAWLKREVGSLMPLEIWVWRSVSVQFLRTFVHAHRGGIRLLRGLFWLEERFPHYFGEKGKYPLIVIRKKP